MRIKEADIQQIRQKANIVEVIGQHLALHKAGRNYTALCPFHNDTNPSLMISSEKQIYKCFVCGAGGNVFTFLQQYQKLTFVEAVKSVADLVGITLDIDDDFFKSKYSPEIMRLFDLLNETISYTTYQLNLDENQRIKDYLTNRNISERAIKKFKIGYNPKHTLNKYLLKKGYTHSELQDVNLIHFQAETDYDVFSNRIVFPIYNDDNQPVGFSGRVVNQQDQPKYINTSETKIYVKGNLLYNLNLAKVAIRSEKFVYLVEGVLDVIAFDEAKVFNVVASLGTALTKQQVNLLKRVTNKVVIAYDGDDAGLNAANQAGKLFQEANFEVLVFNNFQGLDADEYLIKYGNEDFTKAISQSMTWIEFLMDYYLKQYDLNNYQDKKNYTKEIIKEISRLKDNFDQEHYFSVLSKNTGFELATLKQVIKEVKVVRRPEPKIQEMKPARLARELRIEFEIINQILLDKAGFEIFQRELGHLITDPGQQLILLIKDWYLKYDKIEVADLLSDLSDQRVRQLLLTITELETMQQVYNPKVLHESINRLKVQMIDSRIELLSKKISQDQLDIVDITKEIGELRKEKELILKGEAYENI